MILPKPLAPPLQINHWKNPSARKAYRPQRKPVTIAIGFAHESGLLFCADTKVTGLMKANESKIEHFRNENGDCSITFAMSSDDLNFPKMAVLKCWDSVRKMNLSTASIDAVHDKAESSLAQFHRDHIYPHPDRSPTSIYFELLVGIWLRGERRLYRSHETVLNPIDQYDCIGSGAYLAKYLIGQYIKANPGRLDFKDAELLAEYAVGSSSEYDESCDGTPEMLTIANDGTVTGPAPTGDIYFKFVDGISNLIWKFHHNFIHLGDGRWVGKELDSEFKELAEKIRKLHTSIWFKF